MADARYQSGLWEMEVLAYRVTDDSEALVHRAVHTGWNDSLKAARKLAASGHDIVEIVVDDPEQGAQIIWEHRSVS